MARAVVVIQNTDVNNNTAKSSFNFMVLLILLRYIFVNYTTIKKKQGVDK